MIILAAVFFALVYWAASIGSAAAATASQICFIRPGENGSVNILPVTIQVEGYAELTILGEEEVCLKPFGLGKRTLAVKLRFPHPYWGGPTKPPYWTTSPESITVGSGQTSKVLLCARQQNRRDPTWETTGWHGMWILSPAASRQSCDSEYR